MPGDDTRKRIVIAIDGPAGSGKSTLAALLARRYGYTNIETGAMYRALTLKALETKTALEDEAALVNLLELAHFELQPQGEGCRVLLDGRDVTDRVRRTDVTEAVPRVASHRRVRDRMVRLQREFGRQGGVVMEGRDIGTKVFPDAQIKIFLDAAPEVRGSRRFLQDAKASMPEASVLAELRARDEHDRTRANSPLIPAADAVVIDSTSLSLEQVAERAMAIIERKLAEGKS